LKETSETGAGFEGCALADSLELDTTPQHLEVLSVETSERAPALEKSESDFVRVESSLTLAENVQRASEDSDERVDLGVQLLVRDEQSPTDPAESPIGAFSLAGAEGDRGADAEIEELKESSETSDGFVVAASSELDTTPQQLKVPSEKLESDLLEEHLTVESCASEDNDELVDDADDFVFSDSVAEVVGEFEDCKSDGVVPVVDKDMDKKPGENILRRSIRSFSSMFSGSPQKSTAEDPDVLAGTYETNDASSTLDAEAPFHSLARSSSFESLEG